MPNDATHTWATAALRATIARCIRAAISNGEREGREKLRLAAKLRERAKAEGWA